jgi:hypothetical protein
VDQFIQSKLRFICIVRKRGKPRLRAERPLRSDDCWTRECARCSCVHRDERVRGAHACTAGNCQWLKLGRSSDRLESTPLEPKIGS